MLSKMRQFLHVLQGAADGLLHGVLPSEVVKRPRALGSLVQGAVEGLMSMVIELFPEDDGKDSNLHELIVRSSGVAARFLLFQQSAAFEGAREVLAMMKEHYPSINAGAVVRVQASIELTSLYCSLVEDAKFVVSRCELTQIIPESQLPLQ